MPAAIEFQAEHDWPRVRQECHELLRHARQAMAELQKEPRSLKLQLQVIDLQLERIGAIFQPFQDGFQAQTLCLEILDADHLVDICHPEKAEPTFRPTQCGEQPLFFVVVDHRRRAALSGQLGNAVDQLTDRDAPVFVSHDPIGGFAGGCFFLCSIHTS